MLTFAAIPNPLPDAFWDPIRSASAATTFSAFLSGIVLSAMVQVGISQARSGDDRSSSLRFSAVSLVTLLASTYMFVLLAGLSSPAATQDPSKYIPVAQKAALLFGISGSVLAVGAVLTLALMLLIFRESSSHNEVAVSAVRTTLILGAATAGVFLIFGYDDIYQVASSGEHLPVPIVVLMMLLVYGPGASIFSIPDKLRSKVMEIFRAKEKSDNLRSQRPALLAGGWLFLSPTVTYLMVAHLVDSVTPTLAIVLTAACSAWAGISLATSLVVATEAGADGHPS